MPERLTEYDNLFSGNPILRVRLENVGILPPDKAVSYGTSGPTLRGSGIGYDVRKADPFAAYAELNFDVPTSNLCDCYGRYLVRIEEMRQSLRIIEQTLEGLPEGEVLAKGAKVLRPPAGETYSHIESPRGDFGVYLMSDGKDKPVRTRLRAPTFSNLSATREMARGAKIADIVAIIGSIDIVLGEVDR
jgi:NADH-quinone oxidoreductase subunit D